MDERAELLDLISPRRSPGRDTDTERSWNHACPIERASLAEISSVGEGIDRVTELIETVRITNISRKRVAQAQMVDILRPSERREELGDVVSRPTAHRFGDFSQHRRRAFAPAPSE